MPKIYENDLDKNCFLIVVVDCVAIHCPIAKFCANFQDRQFRVSFTTEKILSTFS